MERHVAIIQHWVGQYFDNVVFDTLDDLNAAVLAQVDWINRDKLPYRGSSMRTRHQEFIDYERDALAPLPSIAYEPVDWRWSIPRPNCHIQVDKRHYSVLYLWVGKKLRVGLGGTTVRVYSSNGGDLIVIHQRALTRPGSYVSLKEHQPPENVTFEKLWTRSRYESWSKLAGPQA